MGLLDILQSVGQGVVAAPGAVAGTARDFLAGPGSEQLPVTDQIIRSLLSAAALDQSPAAYLAAQEYFQELDASRAKAQRSDVYRSMLGRPGGEEDVRRAFPGVPIPETTEVGSLAHLASAGETGTARDVIAGDLIARPGSRAVYNLPPSASMLQRERLEAFEREPRNVGFLRKLSLSPQGATQSSQQVPLKDLEGIYTSEELTTSLYDTQPVLDQILAGRLIAEQVPGIPGPSLWRVRERPELQKGREAEATAAGKIRGEAAARHPPQAPKPQPSAESVIEGEPLAIAEPESILPSTLLVPPPDGLSPAQLELWDQAQRNQLAVAKADQERRLAADLKNRTLSSDQRTRLDHIAAARSFLDQFEEMGVYGTTRRMQLGRERFASTLPDQRLTGIPRVTEIGRQNFIVQAFAGDPFLKEFKGLQNLARPVLSRNVGGDVGNLAQNEQANIDAISTATSKPEVRSAVASMRDLLDGREQMILAGKDPNLVPGPAPRPTPSGITPQQMEAYREAVTRGAAGDAEAAALAREFETRFGIQPPGAP